MSNRTRERHKTQTLRKMRKMKTRMTMMTLLTPMMRMELKLLVTFMTLSCTPHMEQQSQKYERFVSFFARAD